MLQSTQKNLFTYLPLIKEDDKRRDYGYDNVAFSTKNAYNKDYYDIQNDYLQNSPRHHNYGLRAVASEENFKKIWKENIKQDNPRTSSVVNIRNNNNYHKVYGQMLNNNGLVHRNYDDEDNYKKKNTLLDNNNERNYVVNKNADNYEYANNQNKQASNTPYNNCTYADHIDHQQNVSYYNNQDNFQNHVQNSSPSKYSISKELEQQLINNNNGVLDSSYNNSGHYRYGNNLSNLSFMKVIGNSSTKPVNFYDSQYKNSYKEYNKEDVDIINNNNVLEYNRNKVYGLGHSFFASPYKKNYVKILEGNRNTNYTSLKGNSLSNSTNLKFSSFKINNIKTNT